MNIVFFTESYPPQKSGVATCVWLEKKYLESLGHKVYVITPKQKAKTGIQDDILYVPSFQFMLAKNDQRFGIPDYNKITLFLYNKDIDIVHTHTDLLLGGAAIMWAKNHHVPLVHTLHTHWQEYIKQNKAWELFFNEKSISSIFQLFIKQCSVLIAPSKKGVFLMQKYKSKITPHVLPNAIDLEDKSVPTITRKALNLKEGDFVIVSVGRVSTEKRVLQLVTSLTPLLKKRSDMHVLLVGDGITSEEIKEYSQEHGIAAQVHITGFVPHEHISSILTVCDMYATASLSEMHSISILEALAAGLPIVTRQDSAYDDTVLQGVNGMQARSDSELADFIDTLYLDRNTLTTYAQASLKIKHNFTPEAHVKQLLKLYQSALEKTGAVA